ncbi:MAG: hypothetical protein JXA09_08940 [Anaerolineae bacterium]|nr:hypothetical protein [Anaerolineae bacterium]
MAKAAVPGKRLLNIAVLCAAIAVCLVGALRVSAQAEPVAYFPETGFNVSGDLLRFYQTHGGQTVFGYPLTRVFEEDGRPVQYFQSARLELHGDGAVVLGALGAALREADPPLPAHEIPTDGHAGKLYVAETGHTVSFSFLDYYRSHGGASVFGYPITEWLIEPSGRIVQYFERAKFEWYPENPIGRRVQLGMLGTIYVAQYVDPVHKSPEPASSRARVSASTAPALPEDALRVHGLQVMVSLEHPIVGTEEEQIVHVYVSDQEGRWVPGASVAMEIKYEGGSASAHSLPATNADGYSRTAFEVASPSAGAIGVVQVSARYGDLVAQSSAAFLPWW